MEYYVQKKPKKFKKKTGQKRNALSYELIDTIHIKELKQYDQYDKLNPVQISIKSNIIIVELTRYRNYKYWFLADSFLFSSAITNDTDIIFITWNSLNQPKTALINVKLSKVLGEINLTQIKNWKLVEGESKWVNAVLTDSE